MQARVLALFAAGLFLLHPVQTESVSYIASRSETLSVFFVLAAFVVFLYRNTGDAFDPANPRDSGAVCRGRACPRSTPPSFPLCSCSPITIGILNSPFGDLAKLEAIRSHRGRDRVCVAQHPAHSARQPDARASRCGASTGINIFSPNAASSGTTSVCSFFPSAKIWIRISPYLAEHHGAWRDHSAWLDCSPSACWRGFTGAAFPIASYGWFVVSDSAGAHFVFRADSRSHGRTPHVSAVHRAAVRSRVEFLRRWKTSQERLDWHRWPWCWPPKATLTYQRNLLWGNADRHLERHRCKVSPKTTGRASNWRSPNTRPAAAPMPWTVSRRAAALNAPRYDLLLDWALAYDCAGNSQQAVAKLEEAARAPAERARLFADRHGIRQNRQISRGVGRAADRPSEWNPSLP